MKLLLATHESSMHHDTGYGHPERPARIPAVVAGIRSSGAEIIDVSPEPAAIEMLTLVHDRGFVDELERFCAAGGGAIDLDTVVGEASWEAALRAAAAGPVLVTRLATGVAKLGYTAMRPPGHHAGRGRAMGFCLFNNVAITAAFLANQGKRVAIVDWDVHHGNGTQAMFYSDPRVLYLSIHQAGIYPGTGSLAETGSGAGEGTNLNIGVPAATGGDFYRRAVGELFVPMIEQFAADWILVSAGYDGHRRDPLASLRLRSSDYGSISRQLAAISGVDGAIVFLEGGYDLAALENSARATVQGWLDPGYLPNEDTDGINPELQLIRAREVAARYWRLS